MNAIKSRYSYHTGSMGQMQGEFVRGMPRIGIGSNNLLCYIKSMYDKFKLYMEK